MNALASTIASYVVITALLWVYAAHLFLAYRRVERSNSMKPQK